MDEPISKAFQSIGNKGKYQYLVLLLLFSINAFVNFILIGPTFIFMNPLFNCSFSDNLLDESQACDRIEQCVINNDFSIVARLDLYCDKQVQRNTIQSVLAIGSVIGLIVINYVADQKGRKKALLLVQFIAIIGFSVTTIGAEYKQISLLVIGQFLCGFGGYSMMLATYLYPYQCFQQSFRQRAIVAVNYSWCLTFSLIGILYYWCNYWRTFLLYFATIPLCIVFLITLMFLAEGPNFLYRKGKIQQCKQSLRFIANINGKIKQFQLIENNIKNVESDETKAAGVYQNLKELFKNKKYIKIVVILAAAQMGGNAYYFGSNYAFDQIGYQYGTNLIAAGIIQVFGFASLNFVIERIPRKKSLILIYGIMGIIGMIFIFEGVRQSTIGTAIILGVLRYLGTIAYMIIIITLTEAFPMKVQSVCSGFVESFAQIGIFLGPIIINLCITLQIHPIIVLSVLLFITVVAPMFGLDQTLKTKKEDSEPLLQNSQKGKLNIKNSDIQ